MYTHKKPVTAVHVLNTDVLPFFEAHGAHIDTILSDNGREFCGRPDVSGDYHLCTVHTALLCVDDHPAGDAVART